MPQFDRYEELAGFVTLRIDMLVEASCGDILVFNKEIRHFSENVLGEVRQNIGFYGNNVLGKSYLSDIKNKLCGLRDELFTFKDDTLMYRPLDFKVKPINIIEHVLLLRIHEELNWLIKAVEEKIALFSPAHNIKKVKQITPRKTGKSLSYSLRTDISEDNFNIGFESLKENALISKDVTYEMFRGCFFGEKVMVKVRWEEVTALVYFIKNLANHKVISFRGGIWICATKCFQDYSGKEFTSNQLGKTKTDAYIKTKIIDDIIKVIQGRKTRE